MHLNSDTLTAENMLDFKPFCAWRYDPQRVSMQEVIAPPYDVISPAEQSDLYDRSPFNCVRLILNRIETTDTEISNRYTRARDFFKNWRDQGVLIQEKEPAFYLYRQGFTDPSTGVFRNRIALLGLLKLEELGSGPVIPHEKTLSRPKEDRRKLLEATHTNFSPVFGLFNDPQGNMAALYKKCENESVLFEMEDSKGVHHGVWTVSQSETVKQIRNLLKDKKIYIADGHHRYQTALEFAAKQRQTTQGSHGDLPSDYVLMALVEFHDPGLILLPIHRIVQTFKHFNEEAALKALQPYFRTEEKTRDQLETVLSKPGADTVQFGLIFGKRAYLLTLSDLESAKKQLPKGKSEIWYKLDVNILSHLIFETLWRLPQDQWESKIKYTASFKEATDAVRQKGVAASFVMKPKTVEVLEKVGAFRELMPQKSTYFFPKLPSGLVFYHHTTP